MDEMTLGRGISRKAFLERAGAAALAAGTVGSLAGAASAASRKTTTLNVWSWQPPAKGGYSDLFNTIFHRFEKAHDGVKISYRYYTPETDYFTKFQSALLAGQGIPDLMEMEWSGRYHQLVDANALTNLDPYLKKGGWPNFFPIVQKQMTYKGSQYGIAMDMNSINMAVNLDILKDHGLSVPRSRDDLIAAAKRLRANNVQPLAVPIRTDWARGDMFFSQLAYIDKTDLALREAEQGKRKWTDPMFVKAAQANEELRDAGVFADGSEGLDIFAAIQLWTAEKAAFHWGYVAPAIVALYKSYRPNMFDFTFTPQPPPSPSTAPRAVGGAAIIWSVPKRSKNVDLAIKLMQQFENPYSARAMYYFNLIPAFPGKVPEVLSPLFKKAVQVEQTVASRSIFDAKVELALTNSMQDLLSGKMNAKQLVQSLQDAA
jgi:raffinose/stachyose/melibiose transport system substrate-binding protein